MSITDFSTLKSTALSITGRTNDSTLSSNMNALVQAAEDRLKDDRRLRRIATVSPVALTTSGTFTFPTDLKSLRSLYITGYEPMTQITNQEMELKRAVSNSAGRPEFFAMEGTQIRLYPTPDQVYSGRLVYEQGIVSLSDTQTATWLLTARPSIYLYALLWEMAVFLKDADMRDTYAARFEEAVERFHQSKQDLEITPNANPSHQRVAFGGGAY